jgi:nucleotide-binding universal stress UspA family protein
MTAMQVSTRPPGPVVVGVDGSPNSMAALRRAVLKAAERGADLEMIYVIGCDADPAAVSAGYAMLDAAARCVAAAGLCVHNAKQTVACGDPAEILVKHGVGAQLLIIGGYGHSGHANLLGGDVVPYCLGRAVCPVIVCADQREPARLLTTDHAPDTAE